MLKFIFILFIFCALNSLSNGQKVNLTIFKNHRQKRGLIFANGGTIKLIIGPAMPITLADPITWRSLVCSYNLHGGHYTLPTEPLYPWDKWEHTYARNLLEMKRKFERFGAYEPDETREFVYTVLEVFMNRQSNRNNGHECLLRAICENAQVHEHIGLFSKVLSVILTPGRENLDNSYRMAFKAGQSGIDCLQYYNKCPKGMSLLDSIINEH